MSEMIERVARAMWPEISADLWADEVTVAPDWDRAVADGYAAVELARRCARAAIEALREPTWAMTQANGSRNALSRVQWENMIAAALAEDQQ